MRLEKGWDDKDSPVTILYYLNLRPGLSTDRPIQEIFMSDSQNINSIKCLQKEKQLLHLPLTYNCVSALLTPFIVSFDRRIQLSEEMREGRNDAVPVWDQRRAKRVLKELLRRDLDAAR